MLQTSLMQTCLPLFRKQKRLTCPNVPRAFCCPFPTPQCPKCPSCQRSSESQTVPATADLHSYTVSRKHAVIIFIFLKWHSSLQQLHIHFISKQQEGDHNDGYDHSYIVKIFLFGNERHELAKHHTLLADPLLHSFIHQIRKSTVIPKETINAIDIQNIYF